jgi:hypothetical protein
MEYFHGIHERPVGLPGEGDIDVSAAVGVGRELFDQRFVDAARDCGDVEVGQNGRSVDGDIEETLSCGREVRLREVQTYAIRMQVRLPARDGSADRVQACGFLRIVLSGAYTHQDFSGNHFGHRVPRNLDRVLRRGSGGEESDSLRQQRHQAEGRNTVKKMCMWGDRQSNT